MFVLQRPPEAIYMVGGEGAWVGAGIVVPWVWAGTIRENKATI